MTRTRITGAALLALALIALLPGVAQAQDATATIPNLAPLLALIPGGAVWVPVAIAVASLLDAILPHPDAGSPLAIPRALVTVLAANVGKASNASGNTLGGAVVGNLTSALSAAGLKVVPSAPQTVTVAVDATKAIEQVAGAQAMASGLASAQAGAATTPTPANDTAAQVAPTANPNPAPVQ